MLHVCKMFLALIEMDFPVIGLPVEFRGCEVSSKMNGLFISGDLFGMVKKEEYQSIDIFFSFVCEFVYYLCNTGYTGDRQMMGVKSVSSKLVVEIF